MSSAEACPAVAPAADAAAQPPAPLRTAATATLLMIVFFGGSFLDLRIPMIVLASAAFFVPAWRTHRVFWTCVTAVVSFAVFQRLYTVDNHKALMAYWCLAVAVACATGSAAALATSARWLIGLVFALATYWKVASPDYLTGEFFEYELLADGRFSQFARLVTNTSPEVFAFNAAERTRLTSEALPAVQFMTTDGVRRLADLMTWGTIAGEGLIATVFLLAPWSAWGRRIRNPLLCAFVTCTYAIATVIGFAWLLCIMGYAQCTDRERLWRRVYLCLLGLCVVYQVPWGQLVLLVSHVANGGF
jgi:hypothetical protein